MLASLGNSPRGPALLSQPLPQSAQLSQFCTKSHKHSRCHTALAQLGTGLAVCTRGFFCSRTQGRSLCTCTLSLENGSQGPLGSGEPSTDLPTCLHLPIPQASQSQGGPGSRARWCWAGDHRPSSCSATGSEGFWAKSLFFSGLCFFPHEVEAGTTLVIFQVCSWKPCGHIWGLEVYG